ncbi:MAG: methyltransferase domain-containing protein [Deltaproteobacteria bacterium]|nr:methyltransferase domain-containing protein [Deltaproteobacteria bacterium]
MTDRLDNRSYYDAMAGGYDRERHRGYHVFLDESEVACVADLVTGADVLEVGCGTGLILSRLAGVADSVVGADLSGEMLLRAVGRVPSVVQANATGLPFPNDTFDVAVSFKVLAHVPPIRETVAEIARVVKPGGYVALEFYNRHSLRTAIKRLKSPSSVASDVDDTDVFTRYDSLADIRGYLPPDLELVRTHGIRIAMPLAVLMKAPVLGPVLAWHERFLARTPLGRFGGFLVAVARKHL